MKFKLNIAEFLFVFEDGDEYAIIKTNLTKDSWKIKQDCYVLSRDKEWLWEPQPSSRTEEFLEKTRMDLLTTFAILKSFKYRLLNEDKK